MEQNTHNQAAAATEILASRTYFGVYTICSDRLNHNHALPLPHEVEWLTNVVSIRNSHEIRVNVTSEEAGLVRWFGLLNYDAVAERTSITVYEGATADEVECLVQTALNPRDDFRPAQWPAHPCVDGRNRIAVCRLIDDEYVNETFSTWADRELEGSLHTILSAGA